MSEFPTLPVAELKDILTQLEAAYIEAKSARAGVSHARASVANMEVVYKDSYNRRALDAVASRAIADVMADAANLAEQRASEAADAKALALSLLAERLRADLCNVASRTAVALGVMAREVRP